MQLPDQCKVLFVFLPGTTCSLQLRVIQGTVSNVNDIYKSLFLDIPWQEPPL